MLLRRMLLVALAGALASTPVLLAQPSQVAALPSDPIALLNLAREKNGLDSGDVKPWHLRGSYTLYDTSGKVSDSGVYEEWWVSPARYKRSFSGGKFAQVEYATGTGIFRTGSQEWLSKDLSEMMTELLRPVPEAQLMKEFTPAEQKAMVSKAELRCVSLMYTMRKDSKTLSAHIPSFCVQPDQPILRMTKQSGSPVMYNQMTLFQGHYLAGDLRRYEGKTLSHELKLDVVQQLSDVEDAPLTAPLGSVAVDLTKRPIRLKNSEGEPEVLKSTIPKYQAASAAEPLNDLKHLVVLQATIGKDGRVVSSTVTSGPSSLNFATKEAVQQWVCRPFLVMGEPVEVEFEIKIEINLKVA